MEFKRVFIAARGSMARRLVSFYAAQGVESVLAFGMAEAEQSVLDEADFDAYLPGETWEEAWLNSERLVAAAMDAGCDAMHPGSWMMAGYRPFVEMAVKANVPVIGVPLDVLRVLADREHVQRRVAEASLTFLPASAVLGSDDDGVAAAAQVGLPAMVQGVGGRGSRRVTTFEEVPEAVAAVRDVERRSMFAEGVYLTRVIPNSRVVAAVVAGDAHGHCHTVGWLESSCKKGRFTWVDECGAVLEPSLRETLEGDSERLAASLGWKGIGRFRWLLSEDGHVYFVGVSARLPSAVALFEKVYGVDLVALEHRLARGENVHHLSSDRVEGRYGMQARIYADADNGGEGVFDAMQAPDGSVWCRGLDLGSPCHRDTEPLLFTLGATGASRSEAYAKLLSAVTASDVQGVPSNVKALREALESDRLSSPA